MIFALSSGPPPAGVAVFRMSGAGTLARLAELVAPRPLPPPRTAMLRSISAAGNGQPIDSVLVLVFPAPHSFTGEDMAEIHCHGSPAVVAALHKELASRGFAPAEPGEFTRRAFLNGRLDLTQAEALADLIAAETEAQRHQALANAGGRLRTRAEGWRATLLDLRAETEADLDFADEADVSVPTTTPAIHALAAEITAALEGAPLAERVRHGLTIAITGPPNAGKSSLVNALAGRDVAIVTPHAGTTRDVIEVALDLGGVACTLLDTAGLRDSDDPVEQEGIRRARDRAAAADLVLDFGDSSVGWRLIGHIDQKGQPPGFHNGAFHLSPTTGAGLETLTHHLVQWARATIPAGEPPLVTTARQAHLLGEARDRLLEAAATPDSVLRAESLRLAATALGRLTGSIDPEEVLGAIFSRFCIGK
jgi:tRNA modification GTPase